MHTTLDCIPCFTRQTLNAARFITDDPEIHHRILRNVLRMIAGMDMSQSPPAMGQAIHRQLRKMTGVKDPYRVVKARFNKLALDMLPDLRRRVQASSDPLITALRMAIAGNVIDFGFNGGLTEAEARQEVVGALTQPFHGDPDAFRNTVGRAQRILYLADNAGEIVFDRLLVEQLHTDRVTVAVRGHPILNDATMVDAKAAGLCDLVEVIENGSDAPGTILDSCGGQFRQRFVKADLIIAKGQGNFETLSEASACIYFLFKAKCSVIADHMGVPLGTHVATRWHATRPPRGGKRHARI